MRAECTETRSWAMQTVSPETFSTLLQFALNRMRHSEVRVSSVHTVESLDNHENCFPWFDVCGFVCFPGRRLSGSTEPTTLPGLLQRHFPSDGPQPAGDCTFCR